MVRRPSAHSPGWLTRTSLFGITALVAMAALALIGWREHIATLVQLRPGYLPLQPNVALALAIAGFGLLAMEGGRRRTATFLALVPVAIGALTLMQYVAGWNLHIDQALVQVFVAVDPQFPGRMSRLTAATLACAGICLLWLNTGFWPRYRPLGTALAASLVASVGFAPLLGWLLGISISSPWSQITRPAPLTAVGLTLLGSLLLLRVWRNDPAGSAGLPSWLPTPVVAAGAVLTLLFASTLRDRELEYVRSATRLTLSNTATVLNFELDSQARALQRMAARWREFDRGNAAMRNQDGQAMCEDFPALRSLTLIGPTLHTAWFYPQAGNEYLIGYNHARDPLHARLIKAARQQDRTVFSPAVQLPLGGTGFLICAPLPIIAQAPAEELIGEFSYPELIETVEQRLNLSAFYAVTFTAAGRRVFERYPSDPVRHRLAQTATFTLNHQRIGVELIPSERLIHLNQRLFPGVIGALGLGLSLLLGLVVDLTRTAHVRRSAAERANARLVAENEERRRAELALRTSQAAARKLSLVASLTDNLVAIADPTGRLEWINESFTRLLAISLSDAIGRPLTQLLVSPDSPPTVVAGLRRALSAGIPFDGDLVCHAQDGRRYDLHLELQPVLGESGAAENFIAMLTDITARVATENHLRRAKEEADAASRAKSEYLASISHEIRTPMNGVIGMTSLLLETQLDPEQRDCVNTIRRSGDALLTIISDILDFSKIESGKMELERQPFELSACLEEALDLFGVQAAAKHIDLAYCIEPEVPAWIVGDPIRLRQVVVNMVNNAIKFTPHGEVSLEVTLADASRPSVATPRSNVKVPAGALLIEFAVHDTGIGIPAEKQSRLFQPFSQVDSSTTRKYGGTGLGLAISRQLVELMGGDIRLTSEPGHGCVFTFSIQARPTTPPASAPPVEPPLLLAQQTALIVDAHAANRRFLALQLARSGMNCVALGSGGAALERLERGEPTALLIVSQLLPDRDGRNLIAEWRRRSAAQPPALLLLPTGDPAPRAWLEEIAPAAFLFKPLKAAPLAAALRSLFAPGRSPADVEIRGDRLLSEEIPLDILVVEDNAANQTVALGLLGRLGYKAVAVEGAAGALQALERQAFQLILMDLQMPEMTGLECTRIIRRRLPPARQPRIIAVTANVLPEVRTACLEAGMNDYLSKPLKLDQLEAAIRRNRPAPGPG